MALEHDFVRPQIVKRFDGNDEDDDQRQGVNIVPKVQEVGPSPLLELDRLKDQQVDCQYDDTNDTDQIGILVEVPVFVEQIGPDLEDQQEDTKWIEHILVYALVDPLPLVGDHGLNTPLVKQTLVIRLC